MNYINKVKLDKRLVKSNFNNAASSYDISAFLQKEVAKRLISRFDEIKVTPDLVLDLGCGTGDNVGPLNKKFKKAKVVNLDIAFNMVKQAKSKASKFFDKNLYVCADMESNCIASSSMDIVFSSMALQWCENLKTLFAQISQSLRPGGLFIFATLGPQTLAELKKVFSMYSQKSHINDFIDMHEVGDFLTSSGFTDPVIESEILTVTYEKPIELLKDLKNIGANNTNSNRPKGLMPPRKMRKILDAYEEYRRDGKVPATYEIVVGHAWVENRKKKNEFTLNRFVR